MQIPSMICIRTTSPTHFTVNTQQKDNTLELVIVLCLHANNKENSIMLKLSECMQGV